MVQRWFSNGSDLCGMMFHDFSCGSDCCSGVGSAMVQCGVVCVYVVQLRSSFGSACCGLSLHGSVVVRCWCDQYVVQMCVRVLAFVQLGLA